MLVYTSLSIAAMPVNYTSEFGEAFEAAASIDTLICYGVVTSAR